MPSSSTGPFYVGHEGLTADCSAYAAAADQPYDIHHRFPASGEFGFSEGDYWDLSMMYVLSATAGDVIYIKYYAPGG